MRGFWYRTANASLNSWAVRSKWSFSMGSTVSQPDRVKTGMQDYPLMDMVKLIKQIIKQLFKLSIT